ncbi:MAG: MFS transporter [Caldilineaceae bacterium]|nr:MFS transporter [Caldilineaceae bacterium]
MAEGDGRIGFSANRGVAGRWHYAWVVALVTFGVLLVSAGVRTASTVLINPLESEFGWSRASISLAAGVSILWFGLGAPLSGLLVERFGPRRIMLGALTLIMVGLGGMLALRTLWQLHLWWGVVVGIGTGAVTNVLGATVAHRWFRTNRGMVLGLFSAAAAAGQLLFLPTMMGLTSAGGWRMAIGVSALAVGALLIPVALLMRDRPEEKGLRPLGEDAAAQAGLDPLDAAPALPLAQALQTRDFWLLAGSFFICGYTTNGLIGTHLLPHAIDHGFDGVMVAGTVSMMGVMNIVGTLASGWLSDRVDNRWLLAMYYAFRAVAIALLPFVLDMRGLLIFAIIYGLDWVATVPPTINLTAMRFGKASVGILFGWIFFSHMVGAAVAAYTGGVMRDALGDYTLAFYSAALLGFIAAAFSVGITPARIQPAQS